MGCASSKRVDATVAAEVYRPGPTSIALFDINTIEEPWLISAVQYHQPSKPATLVPAPILEKLDTCELASAAPHSWSEVSKALDHIKPSLQSTPPPPPQAHASPVPTEKNPLPKKPSFHTLEELDTRLSSPKHPDPARITQLGGRPESARVAAAPPKVEGIRPLRENSFIVMDRLQREGKGAVGFPFGGERRRRDLLSGLPEKCPPGGEEAVVLYTTSLRGVRRTFDDCERVRSAVEGWRVAVDERDVALHGGYLTELRELLGEGAAVPRLFVKGRYVGGVEEVVELSESGRLGELLDSARVERGQGRRACEGCGGARFVPCLGCNGSCKVVDKDGNGTVRCGLCNENGLVHCPLCHSQ